MDHVLCVGREPELARLRSLIDDAGADAGGLVLLEGPAGIGKTTLARACVQAAQQAGGVGRLVASFGPRLESPLGLWARLAADVAHTGREVPADLLDGAVDQLHPHACYAAVHSLVRGLGPAPAVIVFDDLHGADETSLVILAQLAPALSALGVLLVGTLRGAAAHPDPAARDAIAALGPWAETLIVHEMAVNAVRELTLSVAGPGAGEWATDVQHILATRSGGNPLVLRSILDELGVRRGARPSVDDIASLPNRPAAEVIGRHLVSLTPSCHELLEVLALVGGSASRSLVADVLGRDVTHDVHQAVAAGVINDGLGDATLQFVHPVFAEAVESRIGHGSPDAHRSIADALQRRGHPRDLPSIVRHLERSEGRATNAELSRAALDAAEYARRAGDHIGAARLFDVAIDSGEAPDPVELLLRSASAHLFGGSREDGWERAHRAFTHAGPDRPVEQGRAALLFAQQRDYSADTPLAVELLRSALRDLPRSRADDATTGLRTELLALLSVLEMSLPVPIELGGLVDVVDLRGKPAEGLAWYWVTRPQVARPLADEALALARAGGDGDLLARVAFAWRQSYCDPGHLADRLAVTGEAAATASSPADRALAAIATVLDQLEAGNRAAVDAALVELAGLAAATGDSALRWRHGQLAAMLAIASGKPQEAERWSAEAFVHGAQAGESGRWVVRIVQSTVLTVEASHDPTPGIELVASNLDSLAYPPMRGGALSFLARAGRHDLVGTHLHQLVRHILDDPGREASWLSAAAGAADAVATLRLTEYAPPLLDVIAPFADHIALDGLGLHCHGCIARPAARLADVAGRPERAAELRALARERDSAAGLQRFLLEDQLDELEARLAADAADPRRLRSELDRVRLAAHNAGLMILERRARHLADGGATIDLSKRQHDVLAALADGLTYKETGDRLGFSHSTIRHEAMRIYALLGARDRDDAVELARKRGMLDD